MRLGCCCGRQRRSVRTGGCQHAVARDGGRRAQIGRAVSLRQWRPGLRDGKTRPADRSRKRPLRRRLTRPAKLAEEVGLRRHRLWPPPGPDITVFIGATSNSLILAHLHHSPRELQAQFTPFFPSLASPDATSENAATSRQRFAPGNPSVTPSASALHRQTPSAHTDKAET